LEKIDIFIEKIKNYSKYHNFNEKNIIKEINIKLAEINLLFSKFLKNESYGMEDIKIIESVIYNYVIIKDFVKKEIKDIHTNKLIGVIDNEAIQVILKMQSFIKDIKGEEEYKDLLLVFKNN